MGLRYYSMSKTSVYCTGCSWTESGGGWPNYIDKKKFDVTSIAHSGKGLSDIYEYMKLEDLSKQEFIVVQLPTIVREMPPGKTFRRFQNLKKKAGEIGKEAAEEFALDLYLSTIKNIDRLHKNVVFFVFNVGGYPFRHPYDFGESFESRFIDRISADGVRITHLSFEGVAGFALNETSFRKNQPLPRYAEFDGWSIINPPNKTIYDAHPNNSASLSAAEHIQDYLTRVIQDENKTH